MLGTNSEIFADFDNYIYGSQVSHLIFQKFLKANCPLHSLSLYSTEEWRYAHTHSWHARNGKETLEPSYMYIYSFNVFHDQQKVVIEISLNGHISQGIIEMLMCCVSQESNQATKIRTKAMKIAVCIPRKLNLFYE